MEAGRKMKGRYIFFILHFVLPTLYNNKRTKVVIDPGTPQRL